MGIWIWFHFIFRFVSLVLISVLFFCLKDTLIFAIFRCFYFKILCFNLLELAVLHFCLSLPMPLLLMMMPPKRAGFQLFNIIFSAQNNFNIGAVKEQMPSIFISIEFFFLRTVIYMLSSLWKLRALYKID